VARAAGGIVTRAGAGEDGQELIGGGGAIDGTSGDGGAARYAVALAGWNGEVTDEFGRKLRALRELLPRRGGVEGVETTMGSGVPPI